MKIWITRSPARSIMFGGLERLFIWFRPPAFYLTPINKNDRDTPFGDISESKKPHYKRLGWEHDRSGDMWTGGSATLSFGKIFGYCDDDNEHKELAEFVWSKVIEHFHNKPFDEWPELEAQGLAKEEDFLLEIDLSIKLKVY